VDNGRVDASAQRRGRIETWVSLTAVALLIVRLLDEWSSASAAESAVAADGASDA
jgi:hypothetical protein